METSRTVLVVLAIIILASFAVPVSWNGQLLPPAFIVMEMVWGSDGDPHAPPPQTIPDHDHGTSGQPWDPSPRHPNIMAPEPAPTN